MSLVNGVTLIKWSEFSNGGDLVAGDQVVGLRNGLNMRFDFISQSAGETLQIEVHQVAHGFTAGQLLYFNGSLYALAKADSASTSNVIGICQSVTDVDNFILVFGGIFGLSSLIVSGTIYFLSPIVAGGYTSTAPSIPTQVRVVAFQALSTSQAIWLNNSSQQL